MAWEMASPTQTRPSAAGRAAFVEAAQVGPWGNLDPGPVRRRRRDLPQEGKMKILEKLDEGILAASFLMYPMLRTLSLQLHSAITGSYVSGTHSVIFVNCPNEQIARDIARAILDKKLAASVNILPKTSSLFFWKGEIEEATEILLLIKTKTSKVPMLFSFIRLVHPFEIPEVFSLPVDQGDVHYLKWLKEAMED